MKSSRLTNVTIGAGGALIIVIFVVLCLTIFSVLSFTTAYSDLKLSKKTKQITEDYYEVHGRAEEKLSEISDIIILAQKSIDIKSGDSLSRAADFYKRSEEKIRKLEDVKIIKKDNNSLYPDLSLYYEAQGEKNQKICVTLEVLYDVENNRAFCDIKSWNAANIELPEYEDEIFDLWEGIDE